MPRDQMMTETCFWIWGRMNNFKRIGSALLLGGFVTAVVAGASLAFLNNERSIVGLGNAAAFSNCQIQGLGNRLGVEVQTVQYGPSLNCNAANPFDVQEGYSTAALTIGLISLASGVLVLFLAQRRPDVFSQIKGTGVVSKAQPREQGLEESIRSLAKLKEEGLLSESEFRAEKKRLLEGS